MFNLYKASLWKNKKFNEKHFPKITNKYGKKRNAGNLMPYEKPVVLEYIRLGEG